MIRTYNRADIALIETHRIAKASEASLPADQRRQVLIVQSGQIEHTYKPTPWERTKWVASFILSGFAIAAVSIAIADWCMR